MLAAIPFTFIVTGPEGPIVGYSFRERSSGNLKIRMLAGSLTLRSDRIAASAAVSLSNTATSLLRMPAPAKALTNIGQTAGTTTYSYAVKIHKSEVVAQMRIQKLDRLRDDPAI